MVREMGAEQKQNLEVARDLAESVHSVRSLSESLAEPLSAEDQTIQSMPDASPTKWHLAHTSWFFETFVLRKFVPDYRPYDDSYETLFNSYYNSVGEQFARPKRGLISRPGAEEVLTYRHRVDSALMDFVERDIPQAAAELIVLGLHHEQQHQELLLTDIKHALFQNPNFPAYLPPSSPQPQQPQQPGQASGPHRSRHDSGIRRRSSSESPRAHKNGDSPVSHATELRFVEFSGGIVHIGYEGPDFHYDNEGPRHRALLEDFSLADRLLSHGDVLAFIEAGGYDDPLLWLSDGWAWRCEQGMRHPLYYVPDGAGGFSEFTLHGLRPLDPRAPACHLSYFEADALARFFDARLPTEAQWERASARQQVRGHFLRRQSLHDSGQDLQPLPCSPDDEGPLRQLFGTCWEWTQSPYVAYPGYRPPPGAVGEYNGKFMHNQMVLRGGSCASPDGHLRRSYRNFFPSHARWQFAGVRLAR